MKENRQILRKKEEERVHLSRIDLRRNNSSINQSTINNNNRDLACPITSSRINKLQLHLLIKEVSLEISPMRLVGNQ